MTEPSGGWKEILAKVLDVFIKPLSVISNAISERLTILLRRKPKLHVHFHPVSGVWCLANTPDDPVMQIGFQADFTHDDPTQTLILVDVFPEGTRSRFPFRDPIKIDPGVLVTPEHQIWMMVAPVVGKEGENWTGRIVFVDHWKRKYKSKDRFEFPWGGPRKQSAASPSPAPKQ